MYHSKDITDIFFELIINPTDIKYIIIYNRIDECCTFRLSNYSLILKNSLNNEIAQVKLTADISQSYRLTDSGLFTVNVSTVINELSEI